MDIVVAHRADGSGTTQNFTEYLNTAAKGDLEAEERIDGGMAQ